METNKRTQRIIGIVLFATSIIGLIYFLSHQTAQIPQQEENFFLVHSAKKAANESQTQPYTSTHESTPLQPAFAPMEPMDTTATTFEKPTELQSLEEPSPPSATDIDEDTTTQATANNEAEVTSLNDTIQASGDATTNEDTVTPTNNTQSQNPPINQTQQAYPEESLQTQPTTATRPQPGPQASNPTTPTQASEEATPQVSYAENTTEQATKSPQSTAVTTTPQSEQPQKDYWSVQFGVFRQQQLAQKMQHDLEQRYHLKTTLIQQTNTQGEKLYHVILQPFFSSHTHALEASQAFKQSFQISSSLFHNTTLS